MRDYSIKDLAEFINTINKTNSAEISVEVGDVDTVTNIITNNALKIRIVPQRNAEPQLINLARPDRESKDDFLRGGGAAWRR